MAVLNARRRPHRSTRRWETTILSVGLLTCVALFTKTRFFGSGTPYFLCTRLSTARVSCNCSIDRAIPS